MADTVGDHGQRGFARAAPAKGGGLSFPSLPVARFLNDGIDHGRRSEAERRSSWPRSVDVCAERMSRTRRPKVLVCTQNSVSCRHGGSAIYSCIQL